MKIKKYFNWMLIISMFLYSNLSLAVGSSDEEIEDIDSGIKQKKPHKKEKPFEKKQDSLLLENNTTESYGKKLSSLNAQLSALTTQVGDYLLKINENNARLAKIGLPTTVIPCFQEIDILKSLAQTEEAESQQNHISVNIISSSQIYDDVIENFVLYEQLKKLHSKAMPNGDVKIIDAGGGTGLLARHLKAEDPRRDIEIFDLSDKMTAVAINKGMAQTNVHISTMTNLMRSNGVKVPDDSIDGVITNHVLYQLSLQEINQFFTEARRVLKKDGKLSIASMRTVSKKKMDKFTHFLKSETMKMEQAELIPQGFSNLFFACRESLLAQSSPTTFTGQEIISIGNTNGFQEITLDENCYMGTVFFSSFKKL
ncbi:MAG: class I SAM-dependent methyltransferase [Alphaproteobacteria bacterium]|nr:class I SAM-dependent methyltransferase [Alphaproteobacteria bacterium]MBP9776892.1 class I SAM-dependent methyltransferase [Alphaproteobacteria bacterium]